MRTINITADIIALIEQEPLLKKRCTWKKTPKTSKGKKKEVKGKPRRKKVMTTRYDMSVEVDVLVVPKVHLRVAMQMPDGTAVELKPVPPPAEAPKAPEAKGKGEKK